MIGISNHNLVILLIVLLPFCSSVGSGFCSSVKESVASSSQVVFGAIDSDVLSASVPATMFVGGTYKIVADVKNTGGTISDFSVYLSFPSWSTVKYLYSPFFVRNLTLSSGESQTVEFEVTAVNTYVGPFSLRVDLYSYFSDQSILVDTATSTLYEIRTVFQWETVIWIAALIAVSATVALIIKSVRKPIDRRELVIVLALFTMAMSLRLLNIMNVSLYPDEYTGLVQSYDILHQHWTMPKEMMWVGYPPLFIYLRAVMTWLFAGHAMEALRIISAVAGSLTVVVVYYLGKSVFNKKVGALSALLLTFSSFHILFSRLSMTESLVLFFLALAVYFFWKGYGEKSSKFMCVSGIFLGLGLDTKYIALVLIPAFASFILWEGRTWRFLFRKNFLAWLFSALATIAPFQLSLLANEVNPYWWYLNQAFGPSVYPQQVSRPLVEIIPRGLRTYLYWFGRGGSPWLPWLPAFEMAFVVLLVGSLLYHFYFLMKARVKESFIMLSFAGPALFVIVNPIRHSYWLIYSLPFFLIMFSNLTVQTASLLHNVGAKFGSVKNSLRMHKLLPRIMVLLLAIIVIVSTITIGAVAPAIDKGEIDGYRMAMLYVKSQTEEGDIITGWWASYHSYYINLFDLNVTLIPLEKIDNPESPQTQQGPLIFTEFKLNEDVLTRMRPRFIVIDKLNYDFRFDATVKEEVLRNYDIVWFGSPPLGYYWGQETDHQIVFVLERKTN